MASTLPKAPSSPLLRDLTHSLPMALLRTREAVVQRFREVLSRHGLTEQQWRILRALDGREGLEVSLLAEQCQILPPSMSGILKRMEQRGLIVRKANRADGRSILVALTGEAQALVEQIKPEIVAVYAEIERILGRRKLEQLYILLEALEAGLKRNS
ncbi:MAG: homoprotocatechuate degradation operon regulator HpaR [Meiothermus sp.]|uniref:homoprotocatechuate degradation operon regulator HpaR n=1 Tax=Meiothermus sp. TaxID=1955249 RepID=UPI0025CC0F22|nr:homoprotocatechuate degradation operon regulator HpaR [Meiothermus sp.]MCS7068061.1 homoprotocatechuate degradation operon regulator HpaR [Meiothermus sp.]MCX7600442.1 homoprotocatechuate degradation operon regulator HpaR [Meiothermus sp.]MDW8425144.1 homoprotocatechuate degradation operon regulator HpaR [Meiothermus sp.]